MSELNSFFKQMWAFAFQQDGSPLVLVACLLHCFEPNLGHHMAISPRLARMATMVCAVKRIALRSEADTLSSEEE